MLIQTIPVTQINPAPYNPRQDLKPGDAEYEKLKKSINEFGYVEPLVWNKRTGTLVGGHQRLKVLIDQGASEIDVSVVDLPIQKEKALNLALNKISGRWSEDKLAELISELNTTPDFDMSLTGFDLPEISEILDRFDEVKDGDDFDFEAEVNAIKEPITQKGDLIELGPHKILCGDSANLEDMKKLFGSEKVDLVHTDPPYGCLYLAQNRPDLQSRPKKSKRWEKLYKDDLTEKEYEDWIEAFLKNLVGFLKDGASAYIWNGHAKFYFMHHILKKMGFHISTVITWAKPTFAISYGDFNQQTEFCLYAWLKNAPHKWYGPSNETNLWEINREKIANLIHPTQKSVDIPSRAIRNSSQRGDIVADLFLGSGSTLIAAQGLGRRCFGIDWEPKYIDACVRRYIAYVGQENVSEEIRQKYLKEVR